MSSLLENYASNNVLDLIILPTEGCNFRCDYCYENFEIGRMKSEIVESIKKLILNRIKDLEYLSLSWFGGEPLLASDIIIDIMSYVKEIQMQNRKLIVASRITTNGYLLSYDLFTKLVNLGVNEFQITFDGYRNEHDKLRHLAGGGPSFDKIWSNLKAIHISDLNFLITIRVHANSNNFNSIHDLLKFSKSILNADNRFQFFIRNLSRLGGEKDNDLPILNIKDEKEIVNSLIQSAYQLGLKIYTIDDNIHVCYATKLNSFVIRADGRISKCTVDLYNDKNYIGKLNNDGSMNIDKEKLLWWSRGLFSENKQELLCPLNIKD